MTRPLFPRLAQPDDAVAVRVGERELTYRALSASAAVLAATLEPGERVAVVTAPGLETIVGVVGALAAGATVVPVNASTGVRELEHVVRDSEPSCLLAPPGAELPPAFAGLRRRSATIVDAGAEGLDDRLADDDTALILYTSGTTGLPKGVMIPRRAVTSNLDALAAIWAWTARDRLAHALPLFHVHGLVLGLLGPLRLGGSVEHLPRFSPDAVAAALRGGATMLFGVPTMYHRLAQAADDDPSIADALAGARLLVSGSAALPAVVHARIEARTGQRIVERYGMTETLMNISVRADGERRPGAVGLPLPGVEIRLVDDAGTPLTVDDDATIGEIHVRGPNLFRGYLNRPDATAAAFDGEWFRTGDLATRAADGYHRIVGRRATDLIKTAGYRVGAGEIEGALLEHPAVAEAAVAGRPDDDLGERIVAWVVLRPGATASADDLIAHVGALLAGHKRPREVRFVEELPRNELGKVVKTRLPD